MNNNFENLGFGLFVGTLLGILLAFVFGFNTLAMTPQEFKKCEKVCKVNDGLKLAFIDGSCECKNKALFNAKHMSKIQP